jgi:hypothetical protein
MLKIVKREYGILIKRMIYNYKEKLHFLCTLSKELKDKEIIQR